MYFDEEIAGLKVVELYDTKLTDPDALKEKFGVAKEEEIIAYIPNKNALTSLFSDVNFLSVPFRLFCGLHGLADDAADGVGGVTLHPLRGVGVGAEGKARVIVSQCAGQRLDIHAVLEGQRGEGVSEVVKPDVLRADGL